MTKMMMENIPDLKSETDDGLVCSRNRTHLFFLQLQFINSLDISIEKLKIENNCIQIFNDTPLNLT